MTVHEVARQVMKDKRYSQADVAEKAGMKGQSAVAMWLSGKSMRVDNLVKILDACGYDLIVKDRDGQCTSYRISNESGVESIDASGDEPGVVETGEESFDEAVRRIVADELSKREL